MMQSISIRYLSGLDVGALKMSNDEILDAIEGSLIAEGNGETVISHTLPYA